MKVMRLLSHLKHDESERGIFRLSRALITRGHTSIIISSSPKDHNLAKRLQRDGNHYHRLVMDDNAWIALRQILPLSQIMEKYHPDIIHIHSRTAAWLVFWALKFARLPIRPKLVATMYGFYEFNNYSKAILNVDCLITVSDSVTEYLNKRLSQIKKPPKTIIRIYRGVDTRAFPYRHNPSVFWLHSVFTEYPELEHKKWLLFPTIVGPESGQEWLIDILGNLRDKYPNLHVIIMDEDTRPGLLHEEFGQRLWALGLSEQVTFIGTDHHDMREWLAASNIVLALANHPESIGMNVAQALHLGTPVVGWDKAAFAEILKALYPNGLVREYNAYALCEVISNQLDNKTRPAMTDQFTIKQMIKETIEVYNNLVHPELAFKNQDMDANSKKKL